MRGVHDCPGRAKRTVRLVPIDSRTRHASRRHSEKIIRSNCCVDMLFVNLFLEIRRDRTDIHAGLEIVACLVCVKCQHSTR